MALISVIMPVFNQERYVSDAIQSILNQTFRDFEFIIIDDGSTDRTVEMIENFSDERIQLIRAAHKGFIEALKLATAKASGTWLARMDSDDVCSPDRLHKQVDFLNAHPECVFVSTSYGVVTPNGDFLAPKESSKWHYLKPRDITLATFLFADPATMYARDLGVECGYDEQWQNEKPLWYKLLSKGPGVILEECLYFMRFRLGSLSRSSNRDYRGENDRLRFKYDPVNAKEIVKNTSSKTSLRNHRRCVLFYATAGDFAAARQMALFTWRRYPIHRESLGLILVAYGLKRLKSVTGPCKVEYFPVASPFERNQVNVRNYE